MSLTREILEHLAEFGVVMLKTFLPPNYPEARLTRTLLGLDGPCRHRFGQAQLRTISSMLSRLREQGLVERRGQRKNGRWIITKSGIKFLKRKAANSFSSVLALPESDGKIRLMTFDIPEKQRKKRNWLRAQLLACDYKPLHKSVWIGTRPLSEEFVKELDERKVAPYIHLVVVGEKGTLA